MDKTLISILDKLKNIMLVLGLILGVVGIYQLGELHGKVNTAFAITKYKEVCGNVGEYNNYRKQCLINCNDESVYSFDINNNKFCVTEKPKFKDRLFVLMLTGKYLKEKDIHIYIGMVNVIK